MADKTYDAIVIGGGTKGLVLGNYLQRYGGMKTAIFERRHELGGGMSSEESPAPGFIADHHATDICKWYWTLMEKDFPELKERGLKWIPYVIPMGGVFTEDSDCWLVYGEEEDPSGGKTARVWSRFSEKDGETFMKLWGLYHNLVRPAFLRSMNTPVTPMGEPDPMERVMPEFVRGLGLDEPFCYFQSPIELFRDIFESDALIAGMFRIVHSWTAASPHEYAMGLIALIGAMVFTDMGNLEGGTHSAAHATYKLFVEDGGETFTEHEVDKVIIENEKAKGIRLKDGTEVEAKKMVISTLSPRQLVFDITGKEHWAQRTLRRVENLEDWRITIMWYFWALHELPWFEKAAQILPDIQKVGALAIGNKDVESLTRNTALRLLGQWDWGENLLLVSYTIHDKKRAPEGKHVILTEDFQPGANWFSEKEWREYKKRHQEQVLRTLQKVAPNMTWDNVVGCVPNTPFDHCRLLNMAPAGNWGIIDHTPTQLGKFRPVPELARHRTPIKGLYATGSAWPHSGGAWPFQGYTC